MTKTIAIEWKSGPVEGTLEIINGKLEHLGLASGRGKVEDAAFCLSPDGQCRLEVTVEDARVAEGANQTTVTVRTAQNSFTFFLRDVTAAYPIFLPTYGVVVTAADDPRSYEEIEQVVRGRGLLSGLQQIAGAPEESYKQAARHTRDLKCPTWLGLSRDMRIFQIELDRLGRHWALQPMTSQDSYHPARPACLPETNNQPVQYLFVLGRGVACEFDVARRLEEGVLPILHGTSSDGDVVYHVTAFATKEQTPLTAATLRGSHFLVAAPGQLTEEQRQLHDSLLPQEMNRDEEVVLCFRAEAVNTASVPRYAWFKSPHPPTEVLFDGQTGLGAFSSGRVFCVSRLNGKPMPESEVAVLVPPGESAVCEFYLPHRPISCERAKQLAETDFDARHAECRAFWLAKLDQGAKVHLPERRVQEMTQAGLLHLDLVTYGLEPDGTLAPTIGWYSPIGTESAPIILFFDSMGWHDVARRSLMYFLDKQHEDGFVQNHGDYMVETGAALWTMGEHYRYTRDDAWIERVAPKLLKSCEFLINWRRRNQTDELQGSGYGMLDGKVGDPPGPFHYFMNSGYACAGLKRVAEMIAHLDPEKSRKLAAEAEAFQEDIRVALCAAMAKAPVVPLSNGIWSPTAPPYPEYRGPVSLFSQSASVFTHGTFTARDSLVGPLWLVFQEVLAADEPITDMLINYHHELFTVRNVAFSQPFYSRHAFAHLRRGEIKAFLKTYYNGFAGLADRETYTFWEHYFGASPHKTHEEAWFLMQTRWMLYLEDGETLKFLPGIPRIWMEDGKRIEFENMISYFGPVSVHAESKLSQGVIEAQVECCSDRQPTAVEIRLPHPEGRKARSVSGGTYAPEKETVRVHPFTGSAMVTVRF